MADIFNFYVQDDRTIAFHSPEPIMQEDKDVAVWKFRIPKALNQIDMSNWAWWFVYTNAKGQKFSKELMLGPDYDEPGIYNSAEISIDHGISIYPGNITFALEAIEAVGGGGEIIGEWHTYTYSHKVIGTLQGNQAEFAETESDIISALIVQIQQKANALVGGATPIPVTLKSKMTNHNTVYLYTGSESGESAGYWYYWNGTSFVPGGVYASGIVIDPTLTQSEQGADAKAVGDEVEPIKRGELRNLLNGVLWEKGSLDGTTGLPTTGSNRIRSDFVDVSDLKILKVESITSGYKYALYFYDEEQTFVANTSGSFYYNFRNWQTVANNIPLVPAIKYIRVLVANTSNSSSIAIADKNKITLLADYPLLNQQEASEQTADLFFKWLSDDYSTIECDNWAYGVPAAYASNLINNSTTRIWSGFIEIPNIDGTIYLEALTGYQCAYYIYDSNLSKLKEAFWSASYEIEIPSGAKYLAVGLANTSNTAIAPAEGTNVQMTFKPSDNHIQRIENIGDNPSIDFGWELGSLIPNVGVPDGSNTRIRSKFIYVGKGTELVLDNTSDYRHLVYEYDLKQGYIADLPWTADKITIENDCYIRILMRKLENVTITAEEIDTISSCEKVYRAYPQTAIDVVGDSYNHNAVPSYFDSNLSTAIESAKDNVFDAGIDGDSFVFITDVHWQSNAKHSPILIKKVIDSVNVGKIVCGGDLIGGGAKSAMIDLMNDCVNSYRSIAPFYVLFGNHDSNHIGAPSSDDYFSKSSAYALTQKSSDFIMDYGNPCYFSFDNPTTKTRYICLDTGEEGTPLDTTQSTWLSTMLSSMPTGYHALVFAHIVYQTTNSWHVGLQPSDLQRTSFMTAVCDILDTFNANNADKKVEAIFGGHVHIDCNFATQGGIPIILTDCDARQTFTTDDGTIAKHALGTVNEQCFDVVTINYAAKTVKCVRIGRGADRQFTY